MAYHDLGRAGHGFGIFDGRPRKAEIAGRVNLRLVGQCWVFIERFVDHAGRAALADPNVGIELVGDLGVVAACALHARDVPGFDDLDLVCRGDSHHYGRYVIGACAFCVSRDTDADPVRPHAAGGEFPLAGDVPAAIDARCLLHRVQAAGEDLVGAVRIHDFLRFDRQSGGVGIGRPEGRHPGGRAIDRADLVDHLEEMMRGHRIATEHRGRGGTEDSRLLHQVYDVARDVADGFELVAAGLDLG